PLSEVSAEALPLLGRSPLAESLRYERCDVLLRLLTLIFATAGLLLFAAACARTDFGEIVHDTSSFCASVTCSGHGSCVEVGDAASCQCDSGYQPESLNCVAACTGSPLAVDVWETF